MIFKGKVSINHQLDTEYVHAVTASTSMGSDEHKHKQDQTRVDGWTRASKRERYWVRQPLVEKWMRASKNGTRACMDKTRPGRADVNRAGPTRASTEHG